MPSLRLELLGGLRVLLDGNPVAGFYSTKVPALLAYLAVTRRPHSREHLATLLWGEMPDADAKTNLRQALTNLKRLLEPFLDIRRDAVEFRCESSCAVDVWEFEQAREGAPSAARDRGNEDPDLQSLIALYHGDFLQGIFLRDAPEFEEWAIAERARLRELALNAIHRLVTQLNAHGEYTRATEHALKLLTLDPWREEAHRDVMLLYARTGQRSAALTQYAACQKILREQLGVEPSRETNALYERIRVAGDTPAHSLPAQPTSFIGRSVELAQIEAHLLNPQARLITILGVGGTGKTRLAIRAAERAWQLGAFLNGVAFVSLVELESAAQLAPAMANAFGIPLSTGADAKTQIVDYLREKEILVVLDNIEQLLETGAWLGEILQAAPRTKLLVTSREKLNLRWEWVLPLEGMEHRHADSNAVRLFAERARQSSPAFRLDDKSIPAVQHICELVQGLPLGIELAAAWTGQFACDELAREIERSYDVLATSLRDVPARQASLRAVFEHAWTRLGDKERAIFSRLAVFHNGLNLDAARKIADASARDLANLNDKALLRRGPDARYDLHPVLRQYALEKLAAAPEELAAAQAAHSAYYLDLVHDQENSLKTAEQRASMELLLPERDNVAAAWRTAIAHGQWERLGRTLAGLSLFYDMSSQFLAACELLTQSRQAIQQAEEQDLTRARIEAHNAYLLSRIADLTQAQALGESALAGLRELPDAAPADVAFCLNALGVVALDRGELEAAHKMLEEALVLRREAQDMYGVCGTLLNLANVHWQRGDFETARRITQDGLALARAGGEYWSIARFLSALGVLDNSEGKLQEALQVFPESLKLHQELGDIEGAARVLFNYGITYYHLKDYPRSRDLFQASLDMRQTLGDRFGVASCWINLGEISYIQVDDATAEYHLLNALDLFRAIQNKYGTLYALKGLGDLAGRRGRFSEAKSYLRQSLVYANELKAVSLELMLMLSAARLAARQGSSQRGLRLARHVMEHPAVFDETRREGETFLQELALPAENSLLPPGHDELVQELLNRDLA